MREAIKAYSRAIVLNKSDNLLDEVSMEAWPIYDRGQLYEDIGELNRACSDYKTTADMGHKDGQRKVKELCGRNNNIASSNSTTKDSECTNAADYKGCMEFHADAPTGQGISPGTVNVATPSEYNYLPKTVKQLKIRDSYGRYLTFSGRTSNEYAGTGGSYNPGSSGREVCSTNSGMSPTLTLNQGAGRRYSYNYARSSHTNCRTEGYEAPSYKPGTSGGIQAQSFRYELDCKDMTFDRKGDMLDANGAMKGWMNVSADPTAQAVANKYCRIISSLPKSND